MSQPPSIRSEILDLTDAVFIRLGGRATSAMVRERMLPLLSEDQRDFLTNNGLRALVGEYFRRKGNNGLPQAPEVNSAATHCQQELITVDEWRYVARQYFQRAAQNLALGHAAIKRCAEVHGVAIDPETLLSDTRA